MTESMILFAPAVIAAPRPGAPIVAPDFHPDQLGVPWYWPSLDTCFQDAAGTIPCTNGGTIRRINSRGVTGVDLIFPAGNGASIGAQTSASGETIYSILQITGGAANLYDEDGALCDYMSGASRAFLAVSAMPDPIGLKFASVDGSSVALGIGATAASEVEVRHRAGSGDQQARLTGRTNPAFTTDSLLLEVDFVQKHRTVTAAGEIILSEGYDDPAGGPNIEQPARFGYWAGSGALLILSGFAIGRRALSHYERTSLTSWFYDRRPA